MGVPSSGGKGRNTKAKSARSHYVADFETTTTPDDCRVWLWSMVKLGSDSPVWGTDIDSFIEEISQRDSIVHFHNLKFDGTFILDRILRAGYAHAERAIMPGQFQTLIDRMAKFYSVKVMWRNGFATEFRDSLKKLPFSVDRIAKAFNLEISKGKIDYHAPRPVGYVPTVDELDYAFKDVLIVAQALATQLGEGMTRLTAGSDSLAEYKMVLGKRHFDRIFPVLASPVDNDIRLAYRGGFTYAAPAFKGRVLDEPGSVYDVNSLYPAVMHNETLPYGTPEWCDGLPEPSPGYPLFIVSVTFTATLKPDHIPLIQVKGASIFSETEYQSEILEPTTLSFTNVDLDMVFRHYDVDVLSWNGGWRFKGGTGMFNKFIDKWAKIKAENTGALREIAKLHLNSLYGKFASNPNVTGKYPTLENDRVKLKLGPEAEREPIYTAMGAFITAYARRTTITAAQENYARFAYCDTDSLHLVGTTPPVGVMVDPTMLGAWKWEGDFDTAFYIRAKGYMEQTVTCAHGSYVRCGQCVIKCVEFSTHIAGVPSNITGGMRFDDIYDENVLEGKLMPRTVPGGIVLEDKTFTLRL